MNRNLLGIYLNDHLAGSTGALELAKRALGSNRGTDLGAFLERLLADIESDREVLEQLMEQLSIARDPVKQGAAWMAEKAGRLKLNGSLTGYSPLSRLVELEALAVGVTGKRALWQGLGEVDEPAVAGLELERLIARAEDQLAGLEEHRRQAARAALAR